jgi:hypothetical protein
VEDIIAGLENETDIKEKNRRRLKGCEKNMQNSATP